MILNIGEWKLIINTSDVLSIEIFIKKFGCFYFECTSLKWYLLGKHAYIAFSENRNTEDSNDERLIGTECLTGIILQKAQVQASPINLSTHDPMATTESFLGHISVEVSEEELYLLDDFEKEVLLTVKNNLKIYFSSILCKHVFSVIIPLC